MFVLQANFYHDGSPKKPEALVEFAAPRWDKFRAKLSTRLIEKAEVFALLPKGGTEGYGELLELIEPVQRALLGEGFKDRGSGEWLMDPEDIVMVADQDEVRDR